MYTVVLMAALSTSPASTGFHFTHSSCASCTSCTACSGCHGCHGWGHSYSANTYCRGCSCSGCSCYGYTCGGNYTIYAPVGCTGVFGCTGCYGCYGGWSCYGVPLPHHGYWNECPPGATEPGKTSPKIEETPLPKEKQTRARVIIDAPMAAKIYIDGQPVDSAKRVFYTPELVEGEKYFYDVRAEIVRGGQTIAHSQRVILGAGHSVTAAFPNLNQETPTTVPSEE